MTWRGERHPQTSRPWRGLQRWVFRSHIPITTKPETRFVVDGEALPMQAGECRYANFSLLHSVRNDGATDRVHLIIDGIRNQGSDRLFESAGYDFAAEALERKMDPPR